MRLVLRRLGVKCSVSERNAPNLPYSWLATSMPIAELADGDWRDRAYKNATVHRRRVATEAAPPPDQYGPGLAGRARSPSRLAVRGRDLRGPSNPGGGLRDLPKAHKPRACQATPRNRAPWCRRLRRGRVRVNRVHGTEEGRDGRYRNQGRCRHGGPGAGSGGKVRPQFDILGGRRHHEKSW